MDVESDDDYERRIRCDSDDDEPIDYSTAEQLLSLGSDVPYVAEPPRQQHYESRGKGANYVQDNKAEHVNVHLPAIGTGRVMSSKTEFTVVNVDDVPDHLVKKWLGNYLAAYPDESDEHDDCAAHSKQTFDSNTYYGKAGNIYAAHVSHCHFTSTSIVHFYYPLLLSTSINHFYYPHLLSTSIVHIYCPHLLSTSIVHICYPLLLFTSIIHFYCSHLLSTSR